MKRMALFFSGIVLGDQCLKHFVRSMMMPGQSIPVIPDFFYLTYVLNPGAAFGILANHQAFFILCGILILIAAVFFLPRLKRIPRLFSYGAVMMLAGALGNLIDRIHNGLVVDYLDFRIWPVFNLADIAIVIGVGCMMASILRDQEGCDEDA
jgi:signal peptidase II